MIKSINIKFSRTLLLLLSFAMLFFITACGGSLDDETGTGALPGISISISAATSMAAGESSIITATVIDGAGAPVQGTIVTFSVRINNSGATINTLNSGRTDAKGQAIAIYSAGTNSPTTSVQDTIQSSVTGATAVFTIEITAGTGDLSLYIDKGTTSPLLAGQKTIITATVSDGSNNSVSGATVIFDFITGGNNSGATLKTLAGGITDSDGKAYAIYTAGPNNPTIDVPDVITGSASFDVYSATSSVIVWRREHHRKSIRFLMVTLL